MQRKRREEEENERERRLERRLEKIIDKGRRRKEEEEIIFLNYSLLGSRHSAHGTRLMRCGFLVASLDTLAVPLYVIILPLLSPYTQILIKMEDCTSSTRSMVRDAAR